MSARDIIVSEDKTDLETILQKWVNLTGISAMEVSLCIFVTYTHTHTKYIFICCKSSLIHLKL